MLKFFYTTIFITTIGFLTLSPSQSEEKEVKPLQKIIENPPFLNQKYAWADSVFDTLTDDQRIAQLFMVAAYSNKNAAHQNEIKKLVKDYHIGGLIFMQGTPQKQVKLTNTYQKIAQTPLLIAIDGEWGLPMRLKHTFTFPKQMTLGAIQHDSLIYQMGKEMALHCKRMGIHVNFAPSVDVNNNPKNPVINYRSFGENRERVSKKGIAYMKGMQDYGILACAKHFPGHGDTDVDSHKALPVINHSIKRLDSIELYPFKQLINAGVGSMMIAHLNVPALDSTPNIPTTLSKKVVKDLLIDSLKFKGLIFTDALNMKGVSSQYKPGVVDVKALLAGNDVLLFSEDVPTAINEIKKAIKAGEITQEEINERCRKILRAKQWLKVNKTPISDSNLTQDLNPVSSEVTNYLLFENALTLVKNTDSLLPLKRLDTLKIASLVLGDDSPNLFQKYLEKYAKIDHYSLSKSATDAQVKAFLSKVKNNNLVIVSIHNTRMNGNYGITGNTQKIVEEIAKYKKVILNFPTNPYALAKFNTQNMEGIIISYEDKKYSQELVPQLIFGGIKAQGKLPVTINAQFPEGLGIETRKIRLSHAFPEKVGIERTQLLKIDSIVNQSIADQVFPGAQVLVAKQGEVIYNKNFGYHTYNKKREVQATDLYDIASVTKVAATLPIMMKMVETGTLSLNGTLHDYLPDVVDSTAYKKVKIKDMLAHQAGFVPWIPFYQATLKNGELNPRFYQTAQSAFYNTEVAQNIYIFKNYKKAILKRITETNLRAKKYKYSDIGYYFLKEIIERKTGKTLDEVADSLFYKPLGLAKTTYNPLKKYDLDEITPTENDKIFRKQLIHGYVHDQGAALMGGVGGHAGLFSNATELATLMQLYLDGGTYGDVQYFTPSTVQHFTTAHFTKNDNRRGLGFDKPVLSLDGGPTCSLVSLQSYGHSGFTGPRVWVDPKHQLVYVFVTNRVYPDAENWKIVRQNIRTNIEEVIYQSFLN